MKTKKLYAVSCASLVSYASLLNYLKSNDVSFKENKKDLTLVHCELNDNIMTTLKNCHYPFTQENILIDNSIELTDNTSNKELIVNDTDTIKNFYKTPDKTYNKHYKTTISQNKLFKELDKQGKLIKLLSDDDYKMFLKNSDTLSILFKNKPNKKEEPKMFDLWINEYIKQVNTCNSQYNSIINTSKELKNEWLNFSLTSALGK